METMAKYSNCPVGDDSKILTSLKPAVSSDILVDTGIETLVKEPVKEIKLFLVDDDIIYSTAMAHYLRQEIPGLRIRIFQTGESSLLQMSEQPDIVVLDYYLDSEVSSAENGMVILNRIKHMNPATKVIMLSCRNESKIAKGCIKLGAFDYVAKGERAFCRIKYLIMNLSGNNDFWID